MPLQKTIILPDGTSGDFIRLGDFALNRDTREATATFRLYLSAAQYAAAPGAAMKQVIAKLRLNGDRFDAYLADDVLEGEVTLVGQLYVAAKAEPLLAGGGLTALSLADAIDV